MFQESWYLSSCSQSPSTGSQRKYCLAGRNVWAYFTAKTTGFFQARPVCLLSKQQICSSSKMLLFICRSQCNEVLKQLSYWSGWQWAKAQPQWLKYYISWQLSAWPSWISFKVMACVVCTLYLKLLEQVQWCIFKERWKDSNKLLQWDVFNYHSFCWFWPGFCSVQSCTSC